MHLFSQSLSIVLRCGSLLLNDIFCFSSARCILWPSFSLMRLSCRCVIDVMLLHCLCCTRLIRTRIICLLWASICLCQSSTLPSCGCSSSIRVWSIKVWNVPICKVFTAGPDSCVEWPTLHCVWQGNVRWVSGSSQSLVASLSLVFSFSVTQVLEGLRKQFYTIWFYPLWPLLLVLIKIIIAWPVLSHSMACTVT